MAVVSMSEISIFGLRKDRKKILEAIQRMGMVDVRTFKQTDTGFDGMDTLSSRSRFQKAKNDCEAALGILEFYKPESKSLFASFNGRKQLGREDYDKRLEQRGKILNVVSNITKLEKEIADKKARIIKLTGDIDSLSPWRELPVSMKYHGTAKTAAFVGTFPEKRTEASLVSEFAEVCEKREVKGIADTVHFEIIDSTDTQTYAMVICSRQQSAETEDQLRYMGFAQPAFVCDGTPSEKIREFEAEIDKCKADIVSAENELCSLESMREDIKFLADYYSMRIEKYKVLEQLGHSRNTFAMTGYIPSDKAKAIEKELTEKWGAAVECTPADGDDVPVLLKNNGFAAPLEGVLETFSLPGKGEIDPTAAMAVFYYFLFGLMLSDAAYGILMILICGLALWKFPRMSEGLRKSMKMYLYCGISTTFWGVMFGGYFGDAIQVIAKTFFNKDIVIEPLWFSPMNEPMRMLIFSLLVGIIHLFAGLGMKLYSLIKTRNWKDALYDVIFWYMLVGGAIVYLLTMQMFVDMANLSFKLSANVGTIAAIIAGLGALGIALTAGRSSKNPFKRLAKGLYELYGVTSYLSDILSYSRLLALGLATGVIANVFNKMGSMFGGGVLGVIAFTIVFIVGHTLNIGINLLGAYVHTNRLQFVEFFGKFYEGGGEKYSPFKANTEYFEIENK